MSTDEVFGDIEPLNKEVQNLRKVKDRYILRALKTMNWNRTKTAKELGISVRTMRQAVRRFEKVFGFSIPKIYNGRPRK